MTARPVGEDAAFIHGAIERYHEILRGPAGRETARGLLDSLRRTRLVFGDRPICRVLRPLFLTPAESRYLGGEVHLLMRAYRKLYRALGEDRGLRAVLELTADEERMLAADRQTFEPDAIARMDGFLVRGGDYRVIEYNAESPGGIAFGDTLAAIFRELPAFREFSREYRMTSRDGLANTLDALLTAHRHRVGAAPSAPKPSIAVVDWTAAPTRREFEICAEYFASKGHQSRVIQPSELRLEDGKLLAGDFGIDIVYKRVLVKDLMDRGGADHVLAKAVAAGAVTCASGFGVLVLYRKELFALLRDERVTPGLDAEERAAVERCVPWTRLVADIEIDDRGVRRRLLDLVRERRERLVIKPTTEYGGTGVVLGWLVSPERWDEAIKTALGGQHIVQERVELPHETFPVAMDGDVGFERFYADINPFVWNGTRIDGFGARLASGELLNVTAGGGSAVPVFVLERA